ncbi:ATPase, T2SS/T4P/T4SS family [Xenorhabdus nematophila]|uniref:GspE/PulE family protein n=1 Tax=Xenorhabdus nematophila TaxID=628 RepID=UPI0032B824B6
MSSLLQERLVEYKDDNGKKRIAIDINSKEEPEIQEYIATLHRSGAFDYDEIDYIQLSKIQEKKQLNITTYESVDFSKQQEKVRKYFYIAAEFGASDIHITIDGDITEVAMRIHGDLYKVDDITGSEGLALIKTMYMSMCDTAEGVFNDQRRQDGRIASKWLENTKYFGSRYSHIPIANGVFTVLRLIQDDSHNVKTLDELGFLSEQIALIKNIWRRSQGILLLSGPTGSGKSTTLRTLNTMYMERTKGRKRLFTIEDPPEGKIAGARQSPVKIDDRNSQASIAKGWLDSNSAAMRLDPDAILIGEIREYEGAIAAVNASNSGHLVSSTVHASDPVGVLERLVVMGVQKDLLADPSLIIGLVSQRLVPELCPNCKISWSQKVEELSDCDVEYLSKYCECENIFFVNENGCDRCKVEIDNTFISGGVAGRTVVSEVIQTTTEFMEIYREKGPVAARNYWRNEMGGITRLEHMISKINAGRVDPFTADSICPLDENSYIYREIH